ncbi:hypothetical protein DFR40_0186, partial [Azonexus fungiphilus]
MKDNKAQFQDVIAVAAVQGSLPGEIQTSADGVAGIVQPAVELSNAAVAKRSQSKWVVRKKDADDEMVDDMLPLSDAAASGGTMAADEGGGILLADNAYRATMSDGSSAVAQGNPLSVAGSETTTGAGAAIPPAAPAGGIGLLEALGWGLVGVGSVAALSSAGGGGSGNASGSSSSPEQMTIGGTFAAGFAVSGNQLQVSAYSASGQMIGGPATIGADGQFSLAIEKAYAGQAILLRVIDTDTGADYLDEATNQAVDLNADLRAMVVLDANASTATVSITPLSELAVQALLQDTGGDEGAAAVTLGNVSVTDVDSANRAVSQAFGLGDQPISAIMPVVASESALGNALGNVLAGLSGMDSNAGGGVRNSLQQLSAGLDLGTASLSSSALVEFVKGLQTADGAVGGDLLNQVVSDVPVLQAAESAAASADMSTLSASDISTLDPTVVLFLAPAQVASMSALQVGALTGAQVTALSPTQVAAIDSAAVSSLSTTAVAALEPTQVAALSETQVSALSPTQIAAIDPAAVSSLSTTAVAALEPTQVAALSETQVSALSPTQVAAIDPAAVSSLSTTAVAALSEAQVAALEPTQVAALSDTQVAALEPTQVAAIDPVAVSSLSTTAVAVLDASQVAALSVAQLSSLDSSQVQSLSIMTLSVLSAEALAVVEGNFSAEQVAAAEDIEAARLITTDVASTMTATDVEQLSAVAITALGADVVAALSTTAVAALEPTQVAALSDTQVSALSPTQVAAIDPAAVSSLSTTAVAALEPTQVAALSDTQVAALEPTQVAALSDTQVSALS